MMPFGLWAVVGWMALVSFTAIVFLIWGWRNGQFQDVEEAKYRMLEDKEPEPWPGRESDAEGDDE